MSTIKRVKVEVERDDGKSVTVEMDDMTLEMPKLEDFFKELGVGVEAALEQVVKDGNDERS